MEEMREDNGGQSVVEVCRRLVRYAKRAVCYNVWAVGEVETSSIHGRNLGLEDAVILCEV